MDGPLSYDVGCHFEKLNETMYFYHLRCLCLFLNGDRRVNLIQIYFIIRLNFKYIFIIFFSEILL